MMAWNDAAPGSGRGWIRQREQQMGLKAHLTGGAQVEDTDQGNLDRSDLSDIVSANAWADRTVVEQANAPATSAFLAWSRRAPQQCFLGASDQILGAFTARPRRILAGPRAT
jgi:hypothetical protein